MAWINTSLTVTLIGLFRKYTLRRLRGTFRLFTVFQVRKVKMPFVRAESERIIAVRYVGGNAKGWARSGYLLTVYIYRRKKCSRACRYKIRLIQLLADDTSSEHIMNTKLLDIPRNIFTGRVHGHISTKL